MYRTLTVVIDDALPVRRYRWTSSRHRRPVYWKNLTSRGELEMVALRTGGRLRRPRLFLLGAHLERALDGLDALDAPGHGLRLGLLICRFDRSGQIHGGLPADHAEAREVRIVLGDETRLHLRLDPRVLPRIALRRASTGRYQQRDEQSEDDEARAHALTRGGHGGRGTVRAASALRLREVELHLALTRFLRL